MKNDNTTTTTSTTKHDRRHGSSRRSGAIVLCFAAGAVAALIFTGCSAAQRRDMGEQDIHDSLATHVERVVNDHSLSVGESLDCTSTIDTQSHVSASCVGTAVSGQAVTATFTGTADIGAETCTALLLVEIDGEQVIDQPYVQCFDSV
ncbi:MAG TPA: hypothetical protein VHN36_18620 [Ilumatobacteraceae bacterium]|jgi:hypothetical protein|nr:hypothetical protein [Ilumatobacteraceae bacterium]